MVFYTDIPIGRGTYKTLLFNKLKQTSQNVLLYVKKYYESTERQAYPDRFGI